MVRERVERVALIVVGKEDTHQFTHAAITGQANTSIGKHYPAAEVSQHPGSAAILFMDGILIRNVPDVKPEVLQIAEFDMCRVLDVHLDHTIQQ